LHYVSSLSMHSALPTCQPPFMVRSLQLVEVRPYAEEEEEVVYMVRQWMVNLNFVAANTGDSCGGVAWHLLGQMTGWCRSWQRTVKI